MTLLIFSRVVGQLIFSRKVGKEKAKTFIFNVWVLNFDGLQSIASFLKLKVMKTLQKSKIFGKAGTKCSVIGNLPYEFFHPIQKPNPHL